MRTHRVVHEQFGDRCIEEHGLVTKESVKCGAAKDALEHCHRCGKTIGYDTDFVHEWDPKTHSVRPSHFRHLLGQ